jgi:hypothetical protein
MVKDADHRCSVKKPVNATVAEPNLEDSFVYWMNFAGVAA